MDKNKTILVTGGLGFIGSGISCKLLEEGYNVVIIDFDKNAKDIFLKLNSCANLNNTKVDWLPRDLCELKETQKFDEEIDAVIHCAAYKSIAMSISEPWKFYDNNVTSTLKLIRWCTTNNVKRILFSSTAAVYGPALWRCYEEIGSELGYFTDEEGHLCGCYTHMGDPYASSKLICEHLFSKFNSEGGEAIIFRYFNPIGSYRKLICDISDSMFGNGFRAIENNDTFHIFGGDYPTKDGTCYRDYVDLRDIVDAHLAVLEGKFFRELSSQVFNLGTGKALSVLDCCKILKKHFPSFEWDIIERRPGDSEAGIADVNKIFRYYGWKAQYEISDTIRYYIES